MIEYRLSHKKIIHLTRTVYPCRAIEYIRKSRDTLYIQLCFKFTQPIGCVWSRQIIVFYRIVILLVYRSKNTQRTDINKLFGNHIKLYQCINKIFGLQIIDAVKLFLIYTFSQSGTMYNIVKLIIRAFMTG